MGVSITLNLYHPKPQNLIIYVADASGYGVYLGYLSAGSASSCPTYYTTTFADTQTYQNVYSGTAAIPCSTITITPVGSWYRTKTGSNTAITSGTTAPFTYTYHTDSTNGNWVLAIEDTVSGSTGTLYSWAVRLYSKISSAAFSIMPVGSFLFFYLLCLC